MQMYNPKQLQLLQMWQDGKLKRLNILDGSVRSGKTWVSLVLWAFWMASMPKDKNYLMVAKTLTSLRRNVLDLLQSLVGRANFTYSVPAKEGQLFGRRVYLEGVNDARAESKIRGMTLQGAYCDELTLFTEDFFTMLLSRLSDPGAKLLATTNPDNPLHWVKVNYLDRADELNLMHMTFLLEDNQFLDADYVLNLKREYTGHFYSRYVLGNWVRAEGLIYPMFDPKRHVVSKFPRFRRIVIAVDVGQSNATVFLAFGEGDDDRAYLFNEYYHSGRATGVTKSPHVYAQDFAKWVTGIKEATGFDWIYRIYVDPSALGFRTELRDIGFSTTGAKNDVVPGIQVTSSVIDRDLFRVHESCKKTIAELQSYSWDDKAAERGEDTPVKEDDHCMDAMRYYFHAHSRRWLDMKPKGA